MRLIVSTLAVAAIGWVVWWFVIAAAKERAFEAWIADRRAAGWVAEVKSIDVGGFPYRIDTTIRGLDLVNPEGGWAWNVPDLQLLTLAYQPHHLIAIWPGAQTFGTPLGSVRLEAATLRNSIVVEPNPTLALDRAALDMADVGLAGVDSDWRIGIATGQLAIRRSEQADARPHAYDLVVDARNIALPEGLPRALAPVIATLRAEGMAAFDRPLDRAAIEGVPPAVQALRLDDVTLVWGDVDLRGKGALVADAAGFPEGRIDLRAQNWQAMVDAAERSGALGSGEASALRGALGLVAALGGSPDRLETTLDFRGGRVFLGPVPLGSAPRLHRGP